MFFLIGILIFICFITCGYFFLKQKIKTYLGSFGFSAATIKEAIKEARFEDQEIPKSLSSMDSIYMPQIKADFPDLNINQLKRQAEDVILQCFSSVEKKSCDELNGKIKSFTMKLISQYDGKNVKFNDFKIHKTVVSRYSKDSGSATIHFATSFQYYLDVDGECIKTQDRARVEFVYVINEENVAVEKKVLSLHCPNCNSPITSLGNKSCSYCGSLIVDIVGRVFTCNDIVRY